MGTIENLQNKVPCLMSRRTSFIIMTILLGGFFLIEVVVGYVTNSMALIADSFHMLSDVASLIVGYLALKYSTQAVSRDIYTYGYARAEVLGALVNAVFLVALCFSIFIESMKRLIILEGIDNPWLVFFVGLAGLIINIFGMFLFHQTGHGHSHGGMSHSHSHGGGGDHGHSHGGKEGHGHSHGGKEGHGHSHGGEEGHGHSHGGKEDRGHSHGGEEGHGHSHGGKEDDGHSHGGKGGQGHSHGDDDAHGHSHGSESDGHGHTRGGKTQGGNPFLDLSRDEEDKHGGESQQCFYEMDNKDEKTALLATDYPAKSKNTHVAVAEDGEHKKIPPTSGKSAGHLNIEGVYLHILGDALGSIIVMISAMFLIYGRGTWTLYVDPSMSIIMVIIILKTSIPLLMETSTILMNSAPQHIQINDLRERLLKTLPEIKNIHELHVWQLAGDKIIASVHVKFQSPDDYDETAGKIKEFFHDEGIHSTTVQIEFERNDDVSRRGQCMVVCSLDSACDEMMCCKPEEE